jgi:hypothetical protein
MCACRADKGIQLASHSLGCFYTIENIEVRKEPGTMGGTGDAWRDLFWFMRWRHSRMGWAQNSLFCARYREVEPAPCFAVQPLSSGLAGVAGAAERTGGGGEVSTGGGSSGG